MAERGTLRTKCGETEIRGTLHYQETGSIMFTADGLRIASAYSHVDWEFIPDPPVEPEMPYGVYVAKIYADDPENGVKWSHSRRGWKALATEFNGEFRPQSDHPRDFYGARQVGGTVCKDWWNQIVRLVAVGAETRYAAVEPREVNENREIFDALPIGGTFTLTDGWLIRIKTGRELFVIKGDKSKIYVFDEVFPEDTHYRIQAVER